MSVSSTFPNRFCSEKLTTHVSVAVVGMQKFTEDLFLRAAMPPFSSSLLLAKLCSLCYATSTA